MIEVRARNLMNLAFSMREHCAEAHAHAWRTAERRDLTVVVELSEQLKQAIRKTLELHCSPVAEEWDRYEKRIPTGFDSGDKL